MGVENQRRTLRRICSALSIVVAAISCTERPAESPPPAHAPSSPPLAKRSVVLVAIDGVRWQEVFGGADEVLSERAGLSAAERLDAAHLVPNLFRLMTIDGAAVGAPGPGAPMHASGPNFVSLPGYMEMLTGRADTDCTSNHCGEVPFRTIADDVADHAGLAAVIASWPGIEHAAATAPERVLMSIGRHGGTNRNAFLEDQRVAALLRAGESAGPGPGEDDFRRDLDTGRLAAAYLEARRPGFLFVGLGETDEYAHRSDYRSYLSALHDADAIVGTLADDVQRLNADGHPATLIVTTDHGRADGFSSHGGEHPESSRVWLVAAGAGILTRGRAASETTRSLSDVSQTIRRVLGLPGARGASAGKVLSELFVAKDSTLAAR